MKDRQIAIVDSASNPLVSIQPSSYSEAFDRAKPLDHTVGTISRLSALMQAAPSLGMAASTGRKQLMEVVINGNLVRAADGNGLRAIAMEGGKIKEHARLFEVGNLQTAINAAAVWQVASVVVAQKHLADINKKLDEIKAGVKDLSSFLNEQRRSRIKATYDYLNQAYQAIRGGELPAAIRTQLESCERDLLEIQHHLGQEHQRVVDSKVKHAETFGTEDLTKDIARKLDSLAGLGQDMALCLKTRVAAWHVLAVYPGEPELKRARRENIEESIRHLEAMAPHLATSLAYEIGGVKSIWNWESTLEARKVDLSRRLNSTRDALSTIAQMTREGVVRSGELMVEHDQPTRVWLQFEKNAVTGARIEA